MALDTVSHTNLNRPIAIGLSDASLKWFRSHLSGHTLSKPFASLSLLYMLILIHTPSHSPKSSSSTQLIIIIVVFIFRLRGLCVKSELILWEPLDSRFLGTYLSRWRVVAPFYPDIELPSRGAQALFVSR